MTVLAFDSARTDAAQLSADGLHLGYRGQDIVQGLSLAIPRQKFTVIVGANACGKSTLLRGLARLLCPSNGSVYLDGKSIQQMPTRDVARKMGLLPQTPVAPQSILVADLVGRGRYPHQGWFRRWTREDDSIVGEALALTGISDLGNRALDELSGGQRQRVWIAMALAQETGLLLLDEPTTFLDIAHQVDVLDLLTDLTCQQGRTIVAVLHDLNLACRYADNLVAMKDGRIVAEGPPAEIVTAELVDTVYGLGARIVADPVSGTPMVVPLGRHHVAMAAE